MSLVEGKIEGELRARDCNILLKKPILCEIGQCMEQGGHAFKFIG
jgi:hypothetical protein